jgi:ABC-type uncharacterized transport system YnjBCD permease subunit
MWDDAGTEYLDFTSGWSVAAIGYGHPKVIEAVTRQFTETTFASTLSALNESSVRLAHRLADLVPGSFSKEVWFGLSGSDATETLGKMVPLATGRPKLILVHRGLSRHNRHQRVDDRPAIKPPLACPPTVTSSKSHIPTRIGRCSDSALRTWGRRYWSTWKHSP